MSQSNFELLKGDHNTVYEALIEQHGVRMRRSCGGKGLCRSCEAKLLEGLVEDDEISVKAPSTIRTCRSRILSDRIIVECKTSSYSSIARIQDEFSMFCPVNKDSSGLAIAVDIGTTTVSTILMDSESGKILAKASTLNSQTNYADDVLSRIEFCSTPDRIKQMQSAIADETLAKLFKKLLRDADAKSDSVKKVYVAANTTMLHLLLGDDPTAMGKIPFTPKFLDVQFRKASTLFEFLSEADLICLPSISAYVGADVTAGVIVSDMFEKDEISLLVDIGTNGEIVLKKDGKYFSAAAAAGPAFEGYGLQYGMRADAHAISQIEYGDSGFVCRTIGGVEPHGLCGSAYIDFIAVGKEAGILSSAGRFTEKSNCFDVQGKGKCINLNPQGQEILISEEDVSNLLKAKAAIASSIKTLLEKFEIEAPDVDKLYLAGGFGKNLNLSNAINCGLLPDFVSEQVVYLGNSSLAGAAACAMDSSILEKMKIVAKKIENVSLNCEPNFEDNFIDSLFI